MFAMVEGTQTKDSTWAKAEWVIEVTGTARVVALS